MSKKWLLVIFVPLAIILLIAGAWYGLKLNKEKEVKDSFAKTLDMYPIKNLEDLYDKEGYRDENFDKNDKGTWVLYSEMAIKKDGGDLVVEGMVLNINRNNRESKGYYFKNYYNSDIDKYENGKKMNKYTVKMKDNHFYLTKNINDKKLENKIKNFKFFSQYANFKDLDKYKNGNISYNPEVPSYSAEYQLNNNDINVKQLREKYDIYTNKTPKLTMSGDGSLNGDSVGNKELEYIFVRNKKNIVKFSDSIDYKPSS